ESYIGLPTPPRISSISNKTKSVTACNDSLKSRTSNVNAVCATCGKCVFNLNHDACVSKFLNDVNARTKKPKVVPVSTRKTKSQANKYVATPFKKAVASESTIQKSKSYYKMLYEKTSKIVQLILFIVDSGCTKHMTSNQTLLCNFVEKYLATIRFGNDQFAPILSYGDLLRVMLRRGIDLKNSLALGAQLGVFIFSSPLLPHKSLFQSIHLDVKTAFLNGPLKEEVYVAQPDGFVDPDHPEKVYCLRKALYGLKQAPRAWYDELSNFLMSKGFTKGTIDPTLFTIRYGEDILLVQIYVDDIIFRTSDPLIPKRQTTKEKHLKEVKIFRYLRGTINMGLWYPKDSGFELTSFSDGDHAGCLYTRKSTSRGIQFLGDKLVSWMSKKQDCTTMSLAEAEYVALSAGCAQVMWMRTQLKDYGFNYNKIQLYCDSQSTIAISCNPVQHSRTKHIHTRYHFIKEQVKNDIIELYFVRTEYQLADMFTKALPEDRF
ncbi:ribonuclease H-like domain-containing protein, partial [Tanacetum coccineum]